MSASPDISRIHAIYCELTGYQLPLRFDRERAWHEWLRAGHTEDDLRVTIRWIRAGIRNAREGRDQTHRRNEGALRFSNLICQLDLFDEQLAAARLWAGPQSKNAGRPATSASKKTGVEPGEALSPQQLAERIREFRERGFR